jgi:phenylalanyl-tRNA synthetase beta chain
MSREASWLRSNPLEGVLSVVATNVRWQQTAVRIFEIGKVFERAPGLPSERRWLSVALTGSRRDAAWWSSDGGGQVDVYDAKGLAEHVLDALGVRAPVTRETAVGDVKGFEPDCHGVLVAPGGVAVADFGEVSAEVRARFGIPVPVFAAVLSLDEVLRLTPPVVQYQPLPRHPAVQRDLAFVAGRDQAVSAAAVEAAVAEEAGPLLRELSLFDVFTFEDGRRNLAWRLTFQADDRTLRDDDVNEIQQRVARRIERQFSLTWRSA